MLIEPTVSARARTRVYFFGWCGGCASGHRIYDLRHTFASWALAANISMFELARFMGTSVKIIDRHCGHFVRDSEDTVRAKLDAYAAKV
jgi:integrase